MSKPRLLVLSQVLPFPGSSGQQKRVLYTLKAVRGIFHVTFATFVKEAQMETVHEKLSTLVDEVVLLPSLYHRSELSRARHLVAGVVYTLTTGLKRSNYVLGELEFNPERLAEAFGERAFELVLFEYFHAAASTSVFKDKGIPCVLDIHNILWKNYAFQLDSPAALPARFEPALPRAWKKWAVDQYRKREEQAWNRFDGVVIMNAHEEQQVREIVDDEVKIFKVPMGTTLSNWSYAWEPVHPPRMAYYGGLSNLYNVKDVFTCYEQIMPEIWRRFPDVELWLVGSKPTERVRALAADPRVKVTGYVEHVQDVLKTMTLKVMPWSNAHGFRSRLIEVMALGVPVVTTAGVVQEMDVEKGKGIIIEETNATLSEACLNLLESPDLARKQSRLAHEQAERNFSFEATYGQLAKDLHRFTLRHRGQRAVASR